MLKHIHISNFRCFRNVEVPLSPFTVLIGPNNTGKTAFLTAMNLLATSQSGFVRGATSAQPSLVFESDYWNRELKQSPSISATLNKGGELKATPPRAPAPNEGVVWQVEGNTSEIVPTSFFATPSLALSMTSQGVSELEGDLVVNNEASNVPALLDLLLRKHRKRFFRVLDTLKELVPGFVDLNIETPNPQQRRVDLVLENELVLDANQASFGVKLLIFFVALANHPAPPRVILLEEPETGVHPKRLEDIVKLLRGMSQGTFADHATQIVLTTHSPYLLDAIDIDHEQVLVLRRESDGSRNAHPVDRDRLQGFLKEFMLGEVWMNEEESGLLKKEA